MPRNLPKKSNPIFGRDAGDAFLTEGAGTAFAVDNPDGVFTDQYGLGPYADGGPKGREYSQGAGTPKTGGNASGRGKTITLKGK